MLDRSERAVWLETRRSKYRNLNIHVRDGGQATLVRMSWDNFEVKPDCGVARYMAVVVASLATSARSFMLHSEHSATLHLESKDPTPTMWRGKQAITICIDA